MVHAYGGGWRAGVSWLRGRRRHLVFRESPAAWFRRTAVISEDSGDAMVERGETSTPIPGSWQTAANHRYFARHHATGLKTLYVAAPLGAMQVGPKAQ